jgi:glutamate-ammonia-ligase adenylyltransferase
VALERVLYSLREKGDAGRFISDPEDRFCVMALGKLGGNELNYSSDVDLIALWDDSALSMSQGAENYALSKELFARVMEHLRFDLSTHTEEGYAYRVDLRLRPFGSAGELVSTVASLANYYQSRASLWEIQAALKMRPVAGNLKLGYDFIEGLRPVVLRPRNRDDVIESIEKMRAAAMKTSSGSFGSTLDVKSGLGGLREVEFLVQGLQLIHGFEDPSFFEGNTLAAVGILQRKRLLGEEVAEQLKEDYTFLRRIEHYLQILEDRQNHSLPRDPDQLTALAKRVLGSEADGTLFMEKLKGCLGRVHDAYVSHLYRSESC